MLTQFQERIEVLDENFKLFKKSAEICDISSMLEHNTRFMETLRNTNDIFATMPLDLKKKENDSYRKLDFLTQEYLKLTARINQHCLCKRLHPNSI